VGEGAQSPPAAAASAGLHYVDDTRPGITRRRFGKGFAYDLPDGRSHTVVLGLIAKWPPPRVIAALLPVARIAASRLGVTEGSGLSQTYVHEAERRASATTSR